jgi:hypothetical protein
MSNLTVSSFVDAFMVATTKEAMRDSMDLQTALDAKVTSTDVLRIDKLTRAEYDLLSPPIATTLYLVVEPEP